MAKILLINAINPNSEIQWRFPPLGLGYLAASVPGHDVRIVDRGIEKELDNFRPDVVGITAVTQNYKIACQHARAAKIRGLPVIMGGVHISALPGTLSPDMDLAVIGEGETVFPQIIQHYVETGELRAFDAPLIKPLDKIPHPVRNNVGHHAAVFSSRGCPYRCYFCFSSRFWGTVRFFSAEYVVEELRELVSRGVRRISFHDDLFIADENRLYQLVELIRRDTKLSRLKFRVNARANMINERTAFMLSQMHVDSVGLGLESGNQRVLRILKGGRINVEDNYAAIVKLHKNQISANASFVIGYPDETKEELMDTYRFIKESDIDFFDIYVLTPYPGTPAWADAKATGKVSDDMDWARLNVDYGQNRDPVIVSANISKPEMDGIYRKFRRHRLLRAARRIYFNPMFGDVCRAGMYKVGNKLGFKGSH